MANKAISELPQAQNVNNQDLFVLEQSGIAKKLTAETFITEQGIIDALAEALDGHGGIQSVTLASVSGRIRTYRITFSDGSATTFQVYDGTSIDRISRTSSSGLDDVYTIFLSDGTTTFFTVHNGADGTVSEAMLNDALKNKAPVITETTESCAIANFTDGADDMPLHNILAEINPVQDLTYGGPYPAGVSKNLLNMNADITVLAGSIPEAVTITTGEGTASITETYYSRTANIFGWAFNVEENADYTVSCMCSSSKSVTLKIYTGDGTTLYSNNITNNIQSSRTFSSGSNTVLYFYATVTAWGQEIELSNLQIEKSSSATSYMPYSNICPITGHTEVNVTRTGANVWDEEWENGWYASADGAKVSDSNYFRAKNLIPVKPSTSYYFVAPISMELFEWGVNGSYLRRKSNNIQNAVFTTSADCYFLTFNTHVVATTYNHDISINYPSSDHDYHAYQGSNTVTVDWTTEAGTVYGGTIDVATGLLTVDKICFSVLSSTPSISYKGSGNTGYVQINYSQSSNNRWQDLTCSHFKNANIYAGGTAQGVGCYSGQFYIRDSLFTNLTDFTEWIVAQETANTPLQICYKLATPQTYQLSGQQLMTLLGTNNVWADTGNVSVTYPADTKMYIEKLTIPTEDDLVANQAITSGQYFMIGNSLYLALANIASGAQITIGTNAQRVSLADALNTINS